MSHKILALHPNKPAMLGEIITVLSAYIISNQVLSLASDFDTVLNWLRIHDAELFDIVYTLDHTDFDIVMESVFRLYLAHYELA